MHDGEAEIDAGLVLRLVGTQFPRWAGLPVERIASGGTVNAIFRLGDELSVRLPLTASGARSVGWEGRWLHALAPLLPVTIPAVVATGAPAGEYPFAWAVHRWIEGQPAVEGCLTRAELLARDLAEFIIAMREVSLPNAPRAYRGVPLASVDTQTRAAIEELRHASETFDADAALAAWTRALAAPPWTRPSCWVHSDLMPSNLLVADGRLAAVLDFSTAGTGDPACDLIPAWNLLPANARGILREAAGIDDATWTRAQGWALSMAVIQLPYYRTSNQVISANARHVIGEVLGA